MSPHRRHPIFDSFASISEYINGRIPSLYKLPAFTKLTIDNLDISCHQTMNITMAVNTQERKENCRAKENDIYKKLNFNKRFRHAMTFMPIFKRYQTQKEVQVNVTRKNNGKHEFHVHFLALELVFFWPTSSTMSSFTCTILNSIAINRINTCT